MIPDSVESCSPCGVAKEIMAEILKTADMCRHKAEEFIWNSLLSFDSIFFQQFCWNIICSVTQCIGHIYVVLLPPDSKSTSQSVYTGIAAKQSPTHLYIPTYMIIHVHVYIYTHKLSTVCRVTVQYIYRYIMIYTYLVAFRSNLRTLP